MKNTILITGGSGYIGSVTSRFLLQAGYDIVSIDRVKRYLPNVTSYECCISDPLVPTILEKHNVKAVIHFAADHSVPKSLKDPMGVYGNNVTNTLSFLNSCIVKNVKHVVFSSSSSVYGNAGTIDPLAPIMPFVETQPTSPTTPYSRSKVIIEEALKDYERAYGINHISLRYFNAAGSFDGKYGYQINPPEHLLPILVDCAFTGKKFTVNGADYNTPDGTCVRDYTHVNDIARAHISALEYLIAGKTSTVTNLGSNNPHSILEVIREIVHQTDKYIYTVNGPQRDGDMEYTFANIDRSKDILNWNPQYTLSDIVKDEIKWYTHTH